MSLFNTHINDDLDMLRESVRRFAETQIAPLAEEIDATNTFPQPLWQELGEMGLLGMTVDEQYGGSSLGYLAHLVAMEEISRASASVGLSYGAHSNLCLNNLFLHATPNQREKYVPKLCTGEWVGALAMSEPGAGSDVVGSMACTARREGDHFVANGNKMWITNGPEADVLVVYMRTDTSSRGSRGITAFIVEKGMEGFRTAQKLDKLGMRGSNTCELVFEDCRIPVENVLGTIDEGVYILMAGLDSERLVLTGGPLGIMQACMDLVLPYVHERKQFGQPIGEFGIMQAKLADMYASLAATRALAYRTAEQFDAGRPTRQDAAAALMLGSCNAVKHALEAVQILGGNGYINDYPAGRLLRDAKLYEIGAGTTEIRQMLIGRELYRASAPAS
ncbi:MAG: isovaleryl-CoA dehydrogenase [Pseudomonadota bacterium]